MKARYLIGWTITAALAAAPAFAQTPPPQPPPRQTPPPAPSTPRAPAPAHNRAVPTNAITVEGCLLKEADVPGRKPNLAERAGVTEDYILTNPKMIKGTAPAVKGQPMYEVVGLSEAQIKQHAGHRVEIVGVFGNLDRAQAKPETGTPSDDLVELRGATIRLVEGQCSQTRQ